MVDGRMPIKPGFASEVYNQVDVCYVIVIPAAVFTCFKPNRKILGKYETMAQDSHQ